MTAINPFGTHQILFVQGENAQGKFCSIHVASIEKRFPFLYARALKEFKKNKTATSVIRFTDITHQQLVSAIDRTQKKSLRGNDYAEILIGVPCLLPTKKARIVKESAVLTPSTFQRITQTVLPIAVVALSYILFNIKT